VTNEPIDFAGCQLTLAGCESSDVLRRDLAQAPCVDFLYDNTSRWEPSRPCVWLNYTDGHGPDR
jgi:hypothetical protein